MATVTPPRATIDDLLRVDGKAELINGRIVQMAAQRADYFAAGTQVVWDVDPEAELVHVYRASAPDRPVTYPRGRLAEAEPAAPGWRLAVDAIFG